MIWKGGRCCWCSLNKPLFWHHKQEEADENLEFLLLACELTSSWLVLHSFGRFCGFLMLSLHPARKGNLNYINQFMYFSYIHVTYPVLVGMYPLHIHSSRDGEHLVENAWAPLLSLQSKMGRRPASNIKGWKFWQILWKKTVKFTEQVMIKPKFFKWLKIL